MVTKTKEDFIQEAREVHGSAFCYDKVELESYHKKVVITCPEHGDFEQKPYNHITVGQGCIRCSANNRERNPTITTTEFIERSRIAHGDKYDYSKSVFRGARDDIEIVCPRHGSFWQHAHNHYRSKNPTGCPSCAFETFGNHALLSVIDFKRRCSEKFNNRYDYSLVNFERVRDKVKIICHEHGVFEQSVMVHLMGSGCRECAKSRMNLGYTDRHNTTSIYLLEINFKSYTFLKVGISIDPPRRIRDIQKELRGSNIKLLRFLSGDSNLIFEFEQDLHNDKSLVHYWGANFGGMSECYKMSEFEELNKRIDELENQLENEYDRL